MWWVAASILILLLGPLLYGLAQSRRRWLSGLDGFLLVAIGGLVLLDVLPETLEQSGWAALGVGIVGFLGPSLIEHSFHGLARSTHRIAILLALAGLGLHAFVDGAALASTATYHEQGLRALPLAIVLHRVPVGLTIWWLLRPHFGAAISFWLIGLVSAATAAGYSLGGLALQQISGYGLGLVQALVGGSLLHVIVHRTDLHHSNSRGSRLQNRMAAGGGLAGLLLVGWALNWSQDSDGTALRVIQTLWDLAMESAPALVLAYLLAGLMAVFLPPASIRWMSRGNHWSQSLKGMVVGLPLPVCSCGVVPLFRSLSQKGAPASAAVAFLIATPELSLDAVLLSFPLLGPDIAWVRLAAAALVALVVGVTVGLFTTGRTRPKSSAETVTEPPPTPVRERVKLGLRLGLQDIVDDTAPWIIVGLVVAALIEPTLSPETLNWLPAWLEVPLFAAVGIPMYVCASGATPLVAILLLKGISPGAAIAFLLTGPATNLTTFGVVSDTLGKRPALVFGASAITAAVAIGFAANSLDLTVPQLTVGVERGVGPGVISQVSMAMLLALFALSFLRQGPRNFLAQLGLPDTQEDHHCGSAE